MYNPIQTSQTKPQGIPPNLINHTFHPMHAPYQTTTALTLPNPSVRSGVYCCSEVAHL